MSENAIDRATARKALESLRQNSKSAQKSVDTPFEYLENVGPTDDVKKEWFNSPQNRQRIATKHKVNVSQITQRNVVVAGPIRYLTTTIKPGYIERPFPGAILVIIALSYLNHANGLPHQDPSHNISLEPGQDLSLSGDNSQTWDGFGGGIAYLLVLKVQQEAVEQ